MKMGDRGKLEHKVQGNVWECSLFFFRKKKLDTLFVPLKPGEAEHCFLVFLYMIYACKVAWQPKTIYSALSFIMVPY